MKSLSEAHAQALEDKRGIPCEIAAAAGVVSNGNAIGFQYLDRGTVAFTKWRKPDKSFWIDPAGVPLILWNIDSLRETLPEMVIITEGEIDALSWMAAGAVNVVSVPNGARSKPGEGDIIPSEDDAFSYLWSCERIIPELQNVKRIILATDADKPGRILAEELAIRLGRDRCWLVEYPNGCKDTNDVLLNFGVDGVADLLTKAKALWPTELVPVTDIPDNPLSVSHSSGYTELDRHFLLVPPELVVLTGLPNAGKSQFAWNIAAQMARIHGWKCSFIQFEDGVDRIKTSLLRYARTWQREIRCEPHEWVRRHFRAPRTDDDLEMATTDRTMAWVLDRIKEAGQRHGHRLVVIDPWNEIEHDWQKHFTEAQYISRMLKLLKQAARRYSMAIVLVAHPKSASSKEPIDELDLNCVSGGMSWNAKADHGVVLMRAIQQDEIYVKVCKSRDQERMGMPGIVRMKYDKRSGIYSITGSGI